MHSSYEAYLPSLQWISREYHDLNGTHYELLEKPPSALEFSRLVHISRPVLLKGADLGAQCCKWTDEYLGQRMGDSPISVSVTPNGLADAVTLGHDGREYFVEPHVETMTIKELLTKLSATGKSSSVVDAYYLQSQNGNLYSANSFQGQADSSEFEIIRRDVPREVSWFSEAVGKQPDAVNIWIGNSSSTTSIHSDPYENVYTVVRGAKHFTLLPPSEGWCLKERLYPHARYVKDQDDGTFTIQPSSDTPPVRWSSIGDPNAPSSLSEEAHPIHITIQAGETLYLPAGWWHHVRQSAETTIALNWWYDIEMRGMSWVILSLLRGAGDLPYSVDNGGTLA